MNQDEVLVHEVFRHISHAWNTGDAALYASYFSDEVDYITFAGEHLKGRRENEAAHAKLFKTFLKGSTLHSQIVKMQFPLPGMAIVHAVGNVQLRWQKKPSANRKSINTNVLVKQDGIWMVVAFHNCRITRPNILQKLAMSFFPK